MRYPIIVSFSPSPVNDLSIWPQANSQLFKWTLHLPQTPSLFPDPSTITRPLLYSQIHYSQTPSDPSSIPWPPPLFPDPSYITRPLLCSQTPPLTPPLPLTMADLAIWSDCSKHCWGVRGPRHISNWVVQVKWEQWFPGKEQFRSNEKMRNLF